LQSKALFIFFQEIMQLAHVCSRSSIPLPNSQVILNIPSFYSLIKSKFFL